MTVNKFDTDDCTDNLYQLIKKINNMLTNLEFKKSKDQLILLPIWYSNLSGQGLEYFLWKCHQEILNKDKPSYNILCLLKNVYHSGMNKNGGKNDSYWLEWP